MTEDCCQLAASVAKSIEEKRSKFEKQTQVCTFPTFISTISDELLSHEQVWDTLRTERTNLLDGILDSLGSQSVPPDFHDTASDSSLFGSQPSGSDEEHHNDLPETASPGHSPSLTILHTNLNGSNRRVGSKKDQGSGKGKGKQKEDRSRWKTLRDFVDERAIDEALENVEADRASLDVRTRSYPHNVMSILDFRACCRKCLRPQLTTRSRCTTPSMPLVKRSRRHRP